VSYPSPISLLAATFGDMHRFGKLWNETF
jgi:hypothetical protein